MNSNFWSHKYHNYDLICGVDGAWGASAHGLLSGGIGGFIKNKDGATICLFSGPLRVNNILSAEIEAILMVLSLIKNFRLLSKNTVICSDSQDALSNIFQGLKSYYPVSGMIVTADILKVPNISFQYVNRDLNLEADNLAKEGLSRPHMSVRWLGINGFSSPNPR